MNATTEVVTADAQVLPQVDPDQLREDARKYYGQMQTSWFRFGSALIDIKAAYKNPEHGFKEKTFKDFCEAEYPTMHFSTVCKMIRVAEVWGSELSSRIEKDDYKLPAYESCYQLITMENKIPKKDQTKLKKDVLGGKLSFMRLRDQLKEITAREKARLAKEVEGKADELQEELLEDIKTDVGEEVPDFDDASGAEIESRVKALSASCQTRIEYLAENIPLLVNLLDAHPDCVTEETTEMGEALDGFVQKANNFLDKLEEITA